MRTQYALIRALHQSKRLTPGRSARTTFFFAPPPARACRPGSSPPWRQSSAHDDPKRSPPAELTTRAVLGGKGAATYRLRAEENTFAGLIRYQTDRSPAVTVLLVQRTMKKLLAWTACDRSSTTRQAGTHPPARAHTVRGYFHGRPRGRAEKNWHVTSITMRSRARKREQGVTDWPGERQNQPRFIRRAPDTHGSISAPAKQDRTSLQTQTDDHPF